MASSLIKHKRITTTVAKAKELRKYIEPLITKSKDNTTHNRRTVFSYLQDKHVVTELFGEVAAKVANRPGGYTRILKIGNRLGDNADMAIIELVDYNELMLAAKGEKKTATKKRRSRRGGAKKTEAEATETKVEETPAEEVVEAKVEEAPVEEPKAEAKEETPEAKADDTPADEAKDEPKAEDSEEEKKD